MGHAGQPAAVPTARRHRPPLAFNAPPTARMSARVGFCPERPLQLMRERFSCCQKRRRV